MVFGNNHFPALRAFACHTMPPNRVFCSLDQETVSAMQTLVEAGLTAGQAAKQLGIGRATAYRIAKAAR